MREQIIGEIQQRMLPYLTNEQLLHLREALLKTFAAYQIAEGDANDGEEEEFAPVEAFIGAKRVEGCSEITLRYYRMTL